MLIARLLIFATLGIALLALVIYMRTGDVRYKRLAVVMIKWTILAALGFFAVLIGLNLSDTSG
jgi:hypothetical protein